MKSVVNAKKTRNITEDFLPKEAENKLWDSLSVDLIGNVISPLKEKERNSNSYKR